MQICYRCSEETHTRLTAEAREKGISRNRLMDGIIRSHLGQETPTGRASRRSGSGKEIPAAVRLANEKLAGILEALNRFPSCRASGAGPQETAACSILRSEIIGNLLDISRCLETIHTKETSSHV